MPLAITGIVCSSASYFTSALRVEKLRFVVVDHDGGPIAQQLIEAFSSQGPSVHTAASVGVARDMVRYSGWNAGVIIGSQFGDRVDGLELVEMFTLPRGRLAGGLSRFDIEMISAEIRIIEAFITSQFVFSRVLEIVYERMLERFPLVQAYIAANSSRLPAQDSGVVPASPASAILSSDRIHLLLVPSQVVLFAFFSDRNHGPVLHFRKGQWNLSTSALGACFRSSHHSGKDHPLSDGLGCSKYSAVCCWMGRFLDADRTAAMDASAHHRLYLLGCHRSGLARCDHRWYGVSSQCHVPGSGHGGGSVGAWCHVNSYHL